MTIAELGSLGELVGAIAVLATLVYLSIQTRLTREAAQETAGFASSHATYESMTSYDQWRKSILENHELARIMVKARGDEPLTEEEQLLFDLLFERLFIITAVSVQSSFQGTTFQKWDRADVDWFVLVLKENPAAIEKWSRTEEVIRAISPVLAEAIDSEIDSW
jgi:hypothetical protein